MTRAPRRSLGYADRQQMAINIEERRRRRDQRMAVQQASEIVQQAGRGRAIPVGWAGGLFLLAGAVGLALALRYRQMPLPEMGTSLWGGAVIGSLLCNAGFRRGKALVFDLLLAIFAGLPVALLPFYFFPPNGEPLAMLAAAGLAGALFGAAARLLWHLRGSAGTLREAAAAAGQAFNQGMSAAITWLHDAMLKWIFSLFMLAFAAAAIFVSREQQKPLFFWVGMLLVFLIGTTGIWVPGLYNRTAPLVGLRHVGQLAFWVSVLGVPFFEQGPPGDLPYAAKPSVRFVVAGLGLVIAGATWFLQKPSILSRGTRPEPKKPSERGFSLVLVVFGLAVTLVSVQGFQRGQLAIDDTKLSETNFLGTARFDPVDQIQALEIVQPLQAIPFYIDQVVYLDHTTRLVPMLYPGNQYHPDDNGIVKAIRKAANLNTQTFPDKRTERWTR